MRSDLRAGNFIGVIGGSCSVRATEVACTTQPAQNVYRPRNPLTKALHDVVSRHFEEFVELRRVRGHPLPLSWSIHFVTIWFVAMQQ